VDHLALNGGESAQAYRRLQPTAAGVENEPPRMKRGR
jgi:hypothetical protein